MNRFFLLLFLIISISNVQAQVFSGGVTMGLVGSQVAGDGWSGYNKAGLFGGAFVAMKMTERSSLQMELTYFQKGSRENPDEKNMYAFYLLRAGYIELPLLYQYHTGRFIIEAGPSAGFLAGYYEDDNYNIGTDKVVMAPVTMQINLGFSYQLYDKWWVMLRTNDSLFNIRKSLRDNYVWRLWGYGQFNDALVLGVRRFL